MGIFVFFLGFVVGVLLLVGMEERLGEMEFVGSRRGGVWIGFLEGVVGAGSVLLDV